MLSMYRATVCIKVCGLVKKKFRKPQLEEAWIIPSGTVGIEVKQADENSAYQEFVKIAQYYIDDWQKQLDEPSRKGLILTGYNGKKYETPFFWSPRFVTFAEMTFEIRHFKKLYDFKDESMEHCMKYLTPEQFKEEFGFIINS